MLKYGSYQFLLSAVFALLLCSGAFAQERKESDPQTQYKSVVLDGDQKLELDFNISSLGSVTIQVMQKSAPANAEAKGIAGFKVRLRSKDRGFERWYLDQLTDANGNYTFECLRPGNYAIELDPAGLRSAGTATPR